MTLKTKKNRERSTCNGASGVCRTVDERKKVCVGWDCGAALQCAWLSGGSEAPPAYLRGVRKGKKEESSVSVSSLNSQHLSFSFFLFSRISEIASLL
ncbi:hypothetical protein VNO77_12158 [Canavalia gladiata]|uniref:Uncharacterized protein n=1 Tax=Canavalia gladiata TaxID=3824 RepID=A0AAN9M0D5_CANGL